MSSLNSEKADIPVDSQILACLNPQQPKSFFLFAGAGSGKTRSLVNALINARRDFGGYFRLNKKKIAVITYTNAACDEIRRRIEFDPLFSVSTIHSFAWEIIKHYQSDIRTWIRNTLLADIAELQDLLNSGRPGTKTAIDRQTKIDQKGRRLEYLAKIKHFTYSPTGENDTRDSVNHSEVIKMTAYFLQNKPLMQTILVQSFPILFIDESQDTKRELIEALFGIQRNSPGLFSLGLFGDTMQRIYNEGKTDLGINLPQDWVTPSKLINYRCPVRVITLINKIREQTDKRQQIPAQENSLGIAHFFVVDRSTGNVNKAQVEMTIAEKMQQITGDEGWYGKAEEFMTLILEHHMAARRMGFIELFEALYTTESTGLLDGTLPEMRFFTQLILPIIEANGTNDQVAITRIVKEHSPLLRRKFLRGSKEQIEELRRAKEKVNALIALWANERVPTLREIVQNIEETGLFELPDIFFVIAARWKQELSDGREKQKIVAEIEDNSTDDSGIDSWEKALNFSFSQVVGYQLYISEHSRFGTHQGVKGLEFPRVMVILDDDEARGFMFSYDKIFGIKAPSETDLKNIKEGKETGIDRTLRLFYVACSRASRSLAVVIYTAIPEQVKNHVIDQGWFAKEEISIL